MRTRFINTDYFASSSSSPIETLSFLNLPVPHLPPSRLSNLEEQHLLRFDPLPNISLEIQSLPIDAALSKFISQVIPEILDFQYGDFEDPPSPNGKHCAREQRRFSSPSDEIRFSEKEGAEALYGEKKEETQRVFGSEALEVEFPKKDNKTAVDDKHTQRFEVIQFEAPELNALLENTCFSEEGKRMLSEVPEIDNDLDLLRPRLQMQYSNKVQESVYSVEDVTLEYDMDQTTYALEDDGSAQEHAHFHHNTFPLLEVDEITLRIFTSPSMEDEILSFLENIKSHSNKKDNVDIDGMELLGSGQYNIFEILSKHCLSKQSLESELASLDTFPGIDIISMVEPLLTKEDSTDCFLPAKLVVFKEFVFLDVDSSQLYEIFFQKQTAKEPETCDWMFRQDMNFKNFNELIVSCELTLVDDSFKSLPIPIISDHDKIRSMYAVIEEILAEIKPLALSASNGIYLDWHLLDEDKCNFKIFSPFQSMLEELDSHSIDFDQESFDDGKLVIDFVFSDDVLRGPKMERYEELLDMLSESPSDSPLAGVASSNSLDNKYQKPGNGEQLPEENAGKASLLFKSMSQFNDLDFFLNPGKATAKEKGEFVVQVPGTTASFPKEGESPVILAPDENMSNQKLEEPQNCVPTVDKYNMIYSEAGDKVEASCSHVPVPYAPHAMKSEQAQGGLVSFPETIIIVNTQNFDKEMIVSRRSTYQRILAMEKEGAQVVERDLNLPVDVIISTAICLVWYDCRNIGKKATSMDEASSCLPLCIENIATNVLTLMSFTFSSCILIFEGEIGFLSTVMECSDGLYAAAASLGINLQLFCSFTSELTDEIIISSVLYCTKLYRSIYPKMPESETFAESFLTKFPSINSLTAHAILSSIGMLIDFLGWSHEHRILAVQRYHVPDESIALFSALCRYGEREDSRSIMTDCSSSASSCPDSDKCYFNVVSERKRRKCILSSQKVDTHVDDMWQSEPLNQFPAGIHGPSGVCKPYDCGMSTYPELLDELKGPSSSLKDLFGQKQGSDIAQMMDSSTVLKPYDSRNSRGPLILDEITKTSLPLNDKFLDQNQVSEITIKNKVDWNNTSRSKNLHKDIGEVIDLTENPLSGKNSYSIANSMYFSPWVPEMELDSTRKSKAARRLSFSKNSLPTFPTASEINSGSDLWTSVKDDRQRLRDNNGYPDIDDNHDKMSVRHQEKLLGEVLSKRSAGNSKELPFKEEISHYGRTPLSKAIHSAHPQPGSPWTIEFLNRIREKSRLRQQSLTCDTSIPGFGYSGNISKVTKTRSPSILEFFKYQGGSTPGKMHEQKKKNQSIQLSSSSQNESTSASLLPTWTPTDKRSRQTLSFAMDDSGSQTRLVWSDGSAHHLRKKFRNK